MKKKMLRLVICIALCLAFAVPALAGTALPYTVELRNSASFTCLDLTNIGNDPENPVTTAVTTDMTKTGDVNTSTVTIDWTTVNVMPNTNLVLVVDKTKVNELAYETSMGMSGTFEGEEFNIGCYANGSNSTTFTFKNSSMATIHTMVFTSNFDPATNVPTINSLTLSGSDILSLGQTTPANAYSNPIITDGSSPIAIIGSDTVSGIKGYYYIYSADGINWGSWTEMPSEPMNMPFGFCRFMAIDKAGNQQLSGYYYAKSPTPSPVVPSTGDHSSPMLWLCMLAVCAAVLTLSIKRKTKMN